MRNSVNAIFISPYLKENNHEHVNNILLYLTLWLFINKNKSLLRQRIQPKIRKNGGTLTHFRIVFTQILGSCLMLICMSSEMMSIKKLTLRRFKTNLTSRFYEFKDLFQNTIFCMSTVLLVLFICIVNPPGKHVNCQQGIMWQVLELIYM